MPIAAAFKSVSPRRLFPAYHFHRVDSMACCSQAGAIGKERENQAEAATQLRRGAAGDTVLRGAAGDHQAHRPEGQASPRGTEAGRHGRAAPVVKPARSRDNRACWSSAPPSRWRNLPLPAQGGQATSDLDSCSSYPGHRRAWQAEQ